MLRALKGKVDSMQKQMVNVSREKVYERIKINPINQKQGNRNEEYLPCAYD